MKLSDLQKECHRIAKEKGFWDDPNPNDGEKIALMHSELSEALEALREGNSKSKEIPTSSVEEELADTIIRILDYAEFKGFNLEEAVLLKMGYNRAREYKHGKKF